QLSRGRTACASDNAPKGARPFPGRLLGSFRHSLASVVAADGDPVGTVERVVINPRTRAVTDLVVSKGVLFTEDKVVSIDLVSDATKDQITSKKNAGDFSDLPSFEEGDKIPSPGGGADYVTGTLRPVYAYPPLGLPEAAAAGIPGRTTEKERDIRRMRWRRNTAPRW
ncbi:MAG TPA: PRC-barrel domain-containing protein, partial [Aggregatilineales bacterium]|nr:PRC-barrel domain-containing protein [Aggregatilineales bacterium]